VSLDGSEPLPPRQLGLDDHDDDQEGPAHERLVGRVQVADEVDAVLDDAEQQNAAQRAPQRAGPPVSRVP
jgi:hypothetical protein